MNIFLGYITAEQVRQIALDMKGNEYGQYLLRFIAGEKPQMPFHQINS